MGDMPLLPIIKKIPRYRMRTLFGKLEPRSLIQMMTTCDDVKALIHSKELDHIVQLKAAHLLQINMDGIQMIMVRNSRHGNSELINIDNESDILRPFKIWAQYIMIMGPCTPASMNRMTELVRQGQVKVHSAHFFASIGFGWIDCPVETKRFLHEIGAVHVYMSIYISRKNLPAWVFNEITERATVMSIDYCNGDLLEFRAPILEVACPKVNNKGVRHFLKNILEGKRPCDTISIYCENLKGSKIVAGLPASLLYDQANHSDSILHQLEADLMCPLTIQNASYYVFLNPQNLRSMIVLTVNTKGAFIDKIEVTADSDQMPFKIMTGKSKPSPPVFTFNNCVYRDIVRDWYS